MQNNNNTVCLVITSIASESDILIEFAKGCKERGITFVLIGDEASPADFRLTGCDFYNIDRQLATDLEFARVCPRSHYARKNIGYIIAMRAKASFIIETDDDNLPKEDFWSKPQIINRCRTVRDIGWINIYSYFSHQLIWPRGFPLEKVAETFSRIENYEIRDAYCPIQQSLVDENPDVDAIYRLLFPLPRVFSFDSPVALANGSWCPFNSQNTVWFPDAFKLMYLPAYCSFRMTDIWRSFIAQRIAWTNDWSILFKPASAIQKRNSHNLMRDFQEEIPGYLNNLAICRMLEELRLEPGIQALDDNMRKCYEKLVAMGLVDPRELALLEVWLRETDVSGN